jgi:hypothetical protein
MTRETKPAATFADNTGEIWRVKLNYAIAEAVREANGIDFVNAHNGQAYGRLVEDDRTIVATLYVLCETQIKERTLSPQQFAERLDGEVLSDALDAIREAIELFTRPEIRPTINAINHQVDLTLRKAVGIATEKVSSQAATRAIEADLAKRAQMIDDQFSTAGNSPRS